MWRRHPVKNNVATFVDDKLKFGFNVVCQPIETRPLISLQPCHSFVFYLFLFLLLLMSPVAFHPFADMNLLVSFIYERPICILNLDSVWRLS